MDGRKDGSKGLSEWTRRGNVGKQYRSEDIKEVAEVCLNSPRRGRLRTGGSAKGGSHVCLKGVKWNERQ